MCQTGDAIINVTQCPCSLVALFEKDTSSRNGIARTSSSVSIFGELGSRISLFWPRTAGKVAVFGPDNLHAALVPASRAADKASRLGAARLNSAAGKVAADGARRSVT